MIKIILIISIITNFYFGFKLTTNFLSKINIKIEQKQKEVIIYTKIKNQLEMIEKNKIKI